MLRHELKCGIRKNEGDISSSRSFIKIQHNINIQRNKPQEWTSGRQSLKSVSSSSSSAPCVPTCTRLEQQIRRRMRTGLFWLKMPSVSKTAANASPQTEKPTHYTWVEPRRSKRCRRVAPRDVVFAAHVGCIFRIPQLLCVRVCVGGVGGKNMGAFPGFVTGWRYI